ncbi:DUF4007 family protein [Turicibacter sanguinis]|uniref:DUF4007 family protein n=2 Tax=Turicibacter sanguinis TaxID=154288 RepID=A0A9X5AN39_9FIRM|nr:DUF4007 family protein [Turicibacter sanguinis]EFF63360.1 hypothetical protein CUW_1439 [Turicibacter sanguinis PC909]MTK20938.1 DUF4007 family protein [Turicibacter sanguinis]MTK73555.1 DUF4007 family protein [Turicibacter sanguinis]
MGFGQHQSFYLREGWLHKGLEAVSLDESLLSKPDAFEKMGIGKNMLTALRFWLIATGVTKYDVKNKIFSITELGEEIFNNDSNLNLPFTRALIHYNLAKNSEVNDLNGNRSSTVIYWFFNELEGNMFERDLLLEKFTQWASKFKDISINSLKRDIDCLLYMYDINNAFEDPEDVLHSPLSSLELVSKKDNIVKLEGKIENISDELIYYILVDYMNIHELDSLTLNEVINLKKLPGKLFNLKSEQILKNIFSLKKQGKLEFIQTNNLDTIQIKNRPVNSIEVIKQFYKESRDINESII